MDDAPGILALVFAVALAAYGVWSRFLRPRSLPAAVEKPPVANDRTADTIPPMLRPRSEVTPKMREKGGDERAAASKASSSRVPVATRPASVPPAKAAEPVTASAAEREAPQAAQESSPALPRLAIEEDEELEPTKIGDAAKTAAIQPVVEKIVLDEGADAEPAGTAPEVAIFAFGKTDPGKRRKQNQDAFVCLPESSVFVVADGMGGHRGGQTASRLAVETIGDAFTKKQFDAAAHEGLPKDASELARAVQMANTAIFEAAKRDSNLEGMGTTVVAARFTDDKRRLYIAHVGDSRCYRIRDGIMKQLTSDHTMADYGVTGPEGAHLSRALGVWPTVPIDLIMAEPKVGDTYLICSDGLTKMIPDGTIATQLVHEEDSKAAIDRLIFFANSHGGKDNITVVIVRVVPPDWTPPQSS